MLGCHRSQTNSNERNINPLNSSADIRITEEPNFAQDIMYEQMNTFTSYLEKATGLKIEYVPAINYVHSYELLNSGKVDLLWAGSLGTSRVLAANKNAQPIATEVKSFMNVLVVDRKLHRNVEDELNSAKPLQVLKGRRVVFGSNYSGSTFLTPLIEMKAQGVDINDLGSCMHEPKHGHRAMFVGDSDQQDFAFVPGSEGDPLKYVPEQARSEVLVGWVSEIKRNYYIIASPEFLSPSEANKVQKVQNALLALNQASNAHAEVLKALGVTGFELPKSRSDLAYLNEMTEFSSLLADKTRCKKNEKQENNAISE
ncbi:MAG TPA: hypothetical protein DEF79_05550 [Gammaproteobacteria bacterium]|nr:hypothetical protein [Gammaproteobacteria bacterium]